jgi:hypothetical protein
MRRFIVLGGSWGENYRPGDIITAPEHAMADRINKGEVKIDDEAKVEPEETKLLEEVKPEEKTIDEKMKETDGLEENPLMCPVCGRVFKSEKGLKIHKANKHK